MTNTPRSGQPSWNGIRILRGAVLNAVLAYRIVCVAGRAGLGRTRINADIASCLMGRLRDPHFDPATNIQSVASQETISIIFPIDKEVASYRSR